MKYIYTAILSATAKIEFEHRIKGIPFDTVLVVTKAEQLRGMTLNGNYTIFLKISEDNSDYIKVINACTALSKTKPILIYL